MKAAKKKYGLSLMLRFNVVIGICAILLFSCESGVQKVAAIPSLDSIPQISSEDTEVLFSDSSFVKMRLKTKLLEQYSEASEPYTKFPKGVNIQFLNTEKKPTSSLRADFAKYIDKTQIWEFRGNVHHKSENEKELKTELLYVNRITEKMYSDSNVVVTIEEKDFIMKGKGFESDINLYNASMTDFEYIFK